MGIDLLLLSLTVLRTLFLHLIVQTEQHLVTVLLILDLLLLDHLGILELSQLFLRLQQRLHLALALLLLRVVFLYHVGLLGVEPSQKVSSSNQNQSSDVLISMTAVS